MFLWIILLPCLLFAGLQGLHLRHWAWDQTPRIRFIGDVANGYHWGTIASHQGLLQTYNQVIRDHQKEQTPDYGLDYPPLRLAVVQQWAAWTQKQWPGVTSWRNDYDFNRPMLMGNAFCEALSAILAFALVHLWCRRQGDRPEWTLLKATAAALLVWFNPALVWDGHCWPQWDVWVLPFYLGAVLAASYRRWFIAGLLVGLGALFKGQILLAAPVLFLWAIFTGGGWKNALRMVGGFLLPVCVIAGFLFGRDLDWLRVGYGYGATKFLTLGSPGTSNLCWLLHERWGWKQIVGEEGSIHLLGRSIELRRALQMIYLACVLSFGYAAAKQAKANSARLLVAVAGIWVALFAILPQMNARYLIWGAGLMSLMPALGFGMTLLGIFIMLACWAMMADIMSGLDPAALPTIRTISSSLNPDLGWAILLAAGVLIQVALKGRDEAPRQTFSPDPEDEVPAEAYTID